MSATQQAVPTAPTPFAPEGYWETILAYIVTLAREVNSAAFGGPTDVQHATLFATAEAASKLEEALPSFIEKLRTAAVGPMAAAALATQAQPGESGVASQVSPRAVEKVNCALLAEEIIKAQNAGVRFTLKQQHQFEAPCPNVASLFDNGGGGFPRP